MTVLNLANVLKSLFLLEYNVNLDFDQANNDISHLKLHLNVS